MKAKINVTQKLKLGREENIAVKGENAGLTSISSFPKMFLNAFVFRVVKNLGLCGEELTLYHTIRTFRDPL